MGGSRTHISSGGRGCDRGGGDEGLATPRRGREEHAVPVGELHDGLLLRLVEFHPLDVHRPLHHAFVHRLSRVVLHGQDGLGQGPDGDAINGDGVLLLGDVCSTVGGGGGGGGGGGQRGRRSGAREAHDDGRGRAAAHCEGSACAHSCRGDSGHASHVFRRVPREQPCEGSRANRRRGISSRQDARRR